jgi:hypothetical protein
MQSLFILGFVEFLYAERIACGHCAAGVVVNAIATTKISAMAAKMFFVCHYIALASINY